MFRGSFGRRVRIGAVVAIAAGLVAVAQPAFALSGAPDQIWRTNGKVFALAQSGNTMYVGGAFGQALSPSGQRTIVSNIASFNITTGAYISTFTATVANTQSTAKPEVDALGVSSDGSMLYIGGTFDTIDGQPRQNFGAVDTATGTQLSSSVTISPNQDVQVILVGPNLVYLGGAFTKVSGLDRGHLAAFSQADGTLSSVWTPTTAAGTDPCPSAYTGTNCGPTSNGGNGNVRSLAFAPDGNSIFVGGQYYYVDGVPRNTIGRVTTTDGSLLDWRVPWNTIPSDSANSDAKHIGPNVVWSILPTTTRVYVGWGRIPNGFSAFDYNPTPGGITTWRWTDGTPGNAESLALSADGTRLFVGGHFGTAVLDYKISSCGSSVYAHGLVSVNPTNGAYYCDWFPQMVPFGGTSAPGSHVKPPNYVGGWAMQITGNALFVGGYFTSISGIGQSGFARFTLSGSPPPPPPVPVITSFTPTSGQPGSNVVITGTGFTGTTSVTFGAIAATSFTVDFDTQISAIVPGGFTHSPITVTTPGGTAKSSSNFKLIVPSISSFNPTTGPEGTQVVLTGVGFTAASGVQFGGVDAAFNVDSDTQITTTVPVGALTGSITVATLSSGTIASATAFTVTAPPPPPPTITSFAPASGPVGTAVVITGTGFTGATALSFGAFAATSFTVDSDLQITAIVPAGFAHSPIKVTTAGGTAKSATNFVVT